MSERLPPWHLLNNRDFDGLLDRDFDDWQVPGMPYGVEAPPLWAVKSEFTHSGEARAHAQTKKP